MEARAIKLETPVEISEEVFFDADARKVSAKQEVSFQVRVREDGSMDLVILRGKRERKVYHIDDPGKASSITIRHRFRVEMSHVITEMHPFPISISFKGQEYLLKKTAQGKLILTK